MKVFFSEVQQGHNAGKEIVMGSIRPAMDDRMRSRAILQAVEASGLGIAESPVGPVPKGVLQAVHNQGLLDFLQTLHEEWSNTYPDSEGTFPEMGIAPGMRGS